MLNVTSQSDPCPRPRSLHWGPALKWLLAFVLMSVLLNGCFLFGLNQDKEKAEAAATVFFRSLAAEEFGVIYQRASKEFKARTSPQAFEGLMRALDLQFGHYQRHELQFTGLSSQVVGGENQTRVTLTFRVWRRVSEAPPSAGEDAAVNPQETQMLETLVFRVGGKGAAGGNPADTVTAGGTADHHPAPPEAVLLDYQLKESREQPAAKPKAHKQV